MTEQEGCQRPWHLDEDVEKGLGALTPVRNGDWIPGTVAANVSKEVIGGRIQGM